METIQLENENLAEVVARASKVLRAGGVVLYPTDTLYGLGADAFSDDAVAKVYAIKGRDEKKPIHCIVESLAMAEEYVEVNSPAQKLGEKFLPGPLTLVCKKLPHCQSGIARNMETIGIRIPKNDFCLALAKAFGPYTTTSANLAGAENLYDVKSIVKQLGDTAKLIDLAIDAGTLIEQKPSTVVDVSSGEMKTLREGAIFSSAIFG